MKQRQRKMGRKSVCMCSPGSQEKMQTAGMKQEIIILQRKNGRRSRHYVKPIKSHSGGKYRWTDGPSAFTDEFPNITAVLQFVQAGQEGGNALADVISGKVTPSGKLVDSWALDYMDYPNAAYFSHKSGDVYRNPGRHIRLPVFINS